MARQRPAPSRRLIALLFGLALLLVGCGGALPPERRLEVTVTAAGFSPARLEARRGDLVVITLRNRDEVGHNLTIELPTGRRSISSEARVDAVMTFPANDVGTFRFYCAVPGHTEEGVIVISE